MNSAIFRAENAMRQIANVWMWHTSCLSC